MNDKKWMRWAGMGARAAWVASACLGAVSASLADTHVWNGSVSPDWFTPGNWTPGQVPAAGDSVVIDASAAPATNVLLSADTDNLGSLAITNAVLVFTNWNTTLNSASVTIGAGGVFTLPGAFGNSVMSNRIHVVCSTLSLLAEGVIHADGLGYATNSGPGKGGPLIVDCFGGGGHGGVGGRGGRPGGGIPGLAYGSTNAPLTPGSGGGGDATYASGAGGGAIRIEAPGGTVVVNGLISANGLGGNAGGSGGSIYISCGTVSDSSNGVLRANGGNGGLGGGGGGGRIAVQYDSLVNSAGLRFATSPGTGSSWGADQWMLQAGKGTLFLSDATLLSETLSGNLFTDVRVYGFSAWTVNSLTVSNCSIDLAENGFQLTVSNTLTIGTNGAFGVGSELGTAPVGVACGGALILTNGGRFSVYSGPTNMTPDHGALVSLGHDLVIGPGSWVHPYSHSVNGGSALFRMRDLRVSANGGFNAVGRGFMTSQGPGKGGILSARASGGGYGGRGGDCQYAVGGNPYGSTNAPIDAGSGSGTYNAGGGRGGGVVRIEALRRVALDGTITAKGGANVGGGGAGGGLMVKCLWLEGAGILNAEGGNAGNVVHGAGGGGRIALVVGGDALTAVTPGTYAEYAGSPNGRVSVDAGTGGYAAGIVSTNGSFYLSVTPPRQGVFMSVR